MGVGRRLPGFAATRERLSLTTFDSNDGSIDSTTYGYAIVTVGGSVVTVLGDEPINVRNDTGGLLTIGGVVLNDGETAVLIGAGNSRSKFGSETQTPTVPPTTDPPITLLSALAGTNLNDGFYHWASGIPTNNLAKHFSWPFALSAADKATLDTNLNWTFSGVKLFGLTLREGHPLGDYVIEYTGNPGDIEFIGANRSVDGLMWTKSAPIEQLHIQINAAIDMRTLVVRHTSWPSNGWNEAYRNHIGRFGIIRFMDWMKTNRATNQTPWQSSSGDHFEWSDRPRPEQWSYFSNSSAQGSDGLSVPVEVMVDLANNLQRNPWFTMHIKASPAYVQAFAQYVDANLDPGLTARFEFGNEDWNFQFFAALYLHSLYDGSNPSATGNLAWELKSTHHYLTQQMGAIVKSVNANTNRFRVVLGIQHEASLEYQVMNHYGVANLDEFASAPYVGGSVPSGTANATVQNMLGTGTDPKQGLDYIFDVWLPQSQANVNAFTQAKVNNMATPHSIPYLTYEGGQHLTHSDASVKSVFVAANRDPRMYQVYRTMLADWDTITGGNSPYVFFSSTRSFQDESGNPEFTFGHKEYEGQAIATAHKYRAILDHYA